MSYLSPDRAHTAQPLIEQHANAAVRCVVSQNIRRQLLHARWSSVIRRSMYTPVSIRGTSYTVPGMCVVVKRHACALSDPHSLSALKNQRHAVERASAQKHCCASLQRASFKAASTTHLCRSGLQARIYSQSRVGEAASFSKIFDEFALRFSLLHIEACITPSF